MICHAEPRSPHATSATTAPYTQQTTPTDLIDDYAIERVAYHTARVGRRLHLTPDRRDDLQQDLFVSLCEAAKRYDPSKSAPRTFVSRVLCLAAAHHARRIRNERRSPARSPIRLSELQRNGHDFATPAPRWSEPSAHDLSMDLSRGIASLNERQQDLAKSMSSHTVAQIAAERHVHRSTVYREVAAVRTALTEYGLAPTALTFPPQLDPVSE